MSRVLRVTSTVLVAVATAPIPPHGLKTQPLYSQGNVKKTTNARQRMALNRSTTANRISVTKTTSMYALAKNRIVRMSENRTINLSSRQSMKPPRQNKKSVEKTAMMKTAEQTAVMKTAASPTKSHEETAAITSSGNKVLSRSKGVGNLARKSSNKGVLIAKYALDFVGAPYRWGGESPAGFDCSGFVQYVYRHYHIHVPRTSYAQYKVGAWVKWNQLQPGDLVFFSTDRKGASHVGIYIGNDLMVQSLNPSTGVIVSRLSNAYYRNRFIGARRAW